MQTPENHLHTTDYESCTDFWLTYFVKNAPHPENSEQREDFMAQFIERIKADWQTIETAPKLGKLLLWYPCYKFAQIGWWNEADKKFENEGELFCKDKVYIAPTHWMPLPEPPESA